MASWTAVSALPWHHSTALDVDPRDGLPAGATLLCACLALAFRYSGIRNRTYLSSTFHGDDPRRLVIGRCPPCLLVALEHALSERGVLCAEWNSGDDGGDNRGKASVARRATEPSPCCCAAAPEQPPGSHGRRRPPRKIWLALTSCAGDAAPPPGAGRPKSKSLAVAVVHRMEKSSAGSSISMKEDLEPPKEYCPASAARRSEDGGAWLSQL